MKKIKLIIIIYVVSLILLPGIIYAADTNFAEKSQSLGAYLFMGLGTDIETQASIASIAGRYIGIALSFLGAIFLILTIYAGWLWMTAGGNEDQIKKAQKILIRAVIGLVIVLMVYAIAWLIIRIVGPYTVVGEGEFF